MSTRNDERPGETIVWRCDRDKATVRLRTGADGFVRVIIDDGRGTVSLAPAEACQIASGIDVALQRVDRFGRRRR